MPTLRTVTLGCKVNQYETEFVRQALHGIGWQDAVDAEPAELCIVNTCTVTAEGDSKSRQTIRQLAKRNPGTRIVVMGCYATRAPQEVAALPAVADVITDKRELPDWLHRAGVVDVPTGLTRFDGRQRAFVKVQDGCLLHCTFCIIPSVRPHLTSRPPHHILAEIQKLVAHGFQEIVLTGIHLGHYGVEQNAGKPKADWLRLANLLTQISRLPGDFRVRLSSIEATEVTRELIDVMAAHPSRICPHLHISLQSGSESVLRRMQRRWGAKRYVDRCRLVQETLDLPALTTDIIVGFPGETEAEFQETLAVATEVGFSKVHVFPFSARRGTPAAEMPDQITPPVMSERVARLNLLEQDLRKVYHHRLIGKTLRVLVEGELPEGGRVLGTACRYATVELPGDASHRRKLVTVTADVCDGQRVLASPC